MEIGHPQENPKAAASNSTSQDTSNQNETADGAVDRPNCAREAVNAAQTRVERMNDRQVLAMAGFAFPDDYPRYLLRAVRERLAVALAQYGEPAAEREHAAALAAGQAVMWNFAGARRILAEVTTCGIGTRIGWAGVARTVSKEPRLLGRPNARPGLNVAAFGAAYRAAGLRAVERFGVRHPASSVAWEVLAQEAFDDLGQRLGRDSAVLRDRAVELVDLVLGESNGLLLALYMALRGISAIDSFTIDRLAVATGAARLDPRDSFAGWFRGGAAS